jgi:hypothetical protein
LAELAFILFDSRLRSRRGDVKGMGGLDGGPDLWQEVAACRPVLQCLLTPPKSPVIRMDLNVETVGDPVDPS